MKLHHLLLTSALVCISRSTPLLAAPPVRVSPADIRADRELLITHPSVVDSDFAKYPGPWSFGHLVEQVSGKKDAPAAVRTWLELYASGSDGIPARDSIRAKIIEPWQKRDGFDPSSGDSWSPNLANAPFRLLAIVNRMDLALGEFVDLKSLTENAWKIRGKRDELVRMATLTGQSSLFEPDRPSHGFSYGGGGGSTTTISPGGTDLGPSSLGEGRLVFGEVGSDGRALGGGWTIIFEYALTRDLSRRLPGGAPIGGKLHPDQPAVRTWAKAWHRLGEYELEDHRFNEVLAELTRAFTDARPNGDGSISSGEIPLLKQVRSNEACFGTDRVFRQFTWGQSGVQPAFLPMTPSIHYMEDSRDGTRTLSRFLRETDPLIRVGLHNIPQRDPVTSRRDMLARHAIIPGDKPGFHWETKPPISREGRRIFSLSTCNGCHSADTNCATGLHIHPRNAGEASKLSEFLRMDGKPNRFQDPGLKSSYVKQEEILDRAAILAAFLEPRESRRLDTLKDILRDRMRRGH
jgi:hypothetical protein